MRSANLGLILLFEQINFNYKILQGKNILLVDAKAWNSEDGTRGCLKCTPFVFIMYYGHRRKYSKWLILAQYIPCRTMLPLPQYKDMNLPLWDPSLPLCPWDVLVVVIQLLIYRIIKTMETHKYCILADCNPSKFSLS